jgi:glycosyltransferase involved in cell wall biosynthesis
VFALIDTDRQVLSRLGVRDERLRLAGVAPVLPETTDPQGFRARRGLARKPVVFFCGRIVQYKGVTTLLDAARYVWREMPDVHFVFAGPADVQGETWFTERRDGRIQYLGLIDQQEKADALAACDIFCMPSTSEILPAVYLEAWSYGKPVIGGTAHGLSELIEGNRAGIVVKQDPQLLAVRLIELMRNEPLRRQMGEQGRALVERRFSKKAVVHALEETYEALNKACKGRRASQPEASLLPVASATVS